MDLYTKIYEIISKKYYPELPKNKNLEDLCCYYFYVNNINFNRNNEIDLHNIIGKFVDTILDSIYDYCVEHQISEISIITGNGKVIKPKVRKYLIFYNMEYYMENNGKYVIKI